MLVLQHASAKVSAERTSRSSRRSRNRVVELRFGGSKRRIAGPKPFRIVRTHQFVNSSTAWQLKNRLAQDNGSASGQVPRRNAPKSISPTTAALDPFTPRILQPAKLFDLRTTRGAAPPALLRLKRRTGCSPPGIDELRQAAGWVFAALHPSYGPVLQPTPDSTP
jgi:hypothetical protein